MANYHIKITASQFYGKRQLLLESMSGEFMRDYVFSEVCPEGVFQVHVPKEVTDKAVCENIGDDHYDHDIHCGCNDRGDTVRRRASQYIVNQIISELPSYCDVCGNQMEIHLGHLGCSCAQ